MVEVAQQCSNLAPSLEPLVREHWAVRRRPGQQRVPQHGRPVRVNLSPGPTEAILSETVAGELPTLGGNPADRVVRRSENVGSAWDAACMNGTSSLDLLASSPSIQNLQAVPRMPTETMLAAPVHVAIATYAQPRTDLASGRLVGWAIVIAAEGDRTHTLIGRTVSSEPARLIVARLELALSGAQGPVWISVPKRRRGLAATLRSAGFTVTAGLGMGSRAEPELREQIARQSRLLLIEATRSGVVDTSSRSKKPGLPNPSAQVHWLPSEWRVAKHPHQDILLISADASLENVAYSRLFAACAVSDQGDCVMSTGFTQAQIGEVEFIAISQALQIIAESSPRKAVIMSDSVQALEVAKSLAHGAHKAYLAGGCSFDKTSRSRFLSLWQQARSRTQVTFQHVRGHAGYPLNEAADSLARAARRAATRQATESGKALNKLLDETLAAIIQPTSPEGS